MLPLYRHARLNPIRHSCVIVFVQLRSPEQSRPAEPVVNFPARFEMWRGSCNDPSLPTLRNCKNRRIAGPAAFSVTGVDIQQEEMYAPVEIPQEGVS
jgi:hypothetical protein